jgi:hypothetical protein
MIKYCLPQTLLQPKGCPVFSAINLFCNEHKKLFWGGEEWTGGDIVISAAKIVKPFTVVTYDSGRTHSPQGMSMEDHLKKARAFVTWKNNALKLMISEYS